MPSQYVRMPLHHGLRDGAQGTDIIGWGDLDDIDDTEARQRNTRLSRRLTEVTGWAGHTDIREDPKLNEKCEAAAYRVIQDQYGV